MPKLIEADYIKAINDFFDKVLAKERDPNVVQIAWIRELALEALQHRFIYGIAP